MPSNNFKFLLVYQDHGTKLCWLEPLLNKTSTAVAAVLLNIFSMLGPPKILHTDNGREFFGQANSSVPDADDPDDALEDLAFATNVVGELKQLWPECLLVHGRARHSQSQGGVERLNQTVKRRLNAWMQENSSRAWSTGCKMVQWAINSAFHRGTKRIWHVGWYLAK